MDSVVKRKEGEDQGAHHFISDRKVPTSVEFRTHVRFAQAIERFEGW